MAGSYSRRHPGKHLGSTTRKGKALGRVRGKHSGRVRRASVAKSRSRSW